ncbi:MFS transporter [Micromonospora sp. M12]
MRVLQGLGVAAATVVATAAVRDLFSGASFARIFSRLMLVMGLAPILAPTLGSGLLNWTDWRGVFAALAVLGALLIVVAALRLPETLPVARRRHGGSLPPCATTGGCSTTGHSSAWCWSPGWPWRRCSRTSRARRSCSSGSTASTSSSSAWPSGRRGGADRGHPVQRPAAAPLHPQQILVSALIAGTGAGLLLVLFAATGFGGLGTLLASLWLVLAAAGLALPNAPALAMSRHSEPLAPPPRCSARCSSESARCRRRWRDCSAPGAYRWRSSSRAAWPPR